MKTVENKAKKSSKERIKNIILLCATLLFLEVVLRLGAFLVFDFNQYYLFYGVHDLVGRGELYIASGKTGGYYKFPSNYILKGLRGQSSETASVNSLGFRGPEFQSVKPEGVFRIICLGGSSTFGFHNRDTGTYPFQLEQLFRQHKGYMKVEAINAGFPYYYTGNILPLLEEELLDYQPDILTFYSAGNDSGYPLSEEALSGIFSWLKKRSIIVSLVHSFIKKAQNMRTFKKIIKSVSHSVDPVKFENDTKQFVMRYRGNVKKIVDLAKKNNVPVIFIKQPITTDNKKYVALSYDEEYKLILNQLNEHNSLLIKELMLLRHHKFMEELEDIAHEEDIPIVDNIKIVDQHRRRLESWVHLSEEANLRLAEALKLVIEPYVVQK
jgi:lysophospholipase L1-like esterase